MKTLIWFYRDLRTDDHEALSRVLRDGDIAQAIVLRRTEGRGEFQARFWEECVAELGRRLAQAKIELRILEGSAEQAISEYVRQHGIERVFTHRRMNARDHHEVERVAASIGVPLEVLGETTLYPASLGDGLALSELRQFTAFKKKFLDPVERPLPRARERVFESTTSEAPSEKFRGGESAGLARLSDYLWNTKSVRHYHETRNGMLRFDDSSKLSPWLALGALSPRRVASELRRFEETHGSGEGTAALLYELQWRDYFKFLATKIGDALFSRDGLRSTPREWKQDSEKFQIWRTGNTGQSFIDANLRELLLTGWMSNRGRQNVASFLAKTIGLDWRDGARWFEAQLIDADPESNYGNWQYVAGVGTDPRDRLFDPERQAALYDAQGEYRKRWLALSE